MARTRACAASGRSHSRQSIRPPAPPHTPASRKSPCASDAVERLPLQVRRGLDGGKHELAPAIGATQSAQALDFMKEAPVLGQDLAHVHRLGRRQRQVVRAGRKRELAEVPARRIAVRLGAIDHQHVLVPFTAQLPGRGQAGDAGAEDGDVGLFAVRLRQCKKPPFVELQISEHADRMFKP